VNHCLSSRLSACPIYDNGASLGYQLQEERILKMFQDQRMFTAFTNRSYSLIGLPDKKKPKYRELLNFIYQLYPQETKEMVERISQINEKQILVILSKISEEAMSKVYKEWVLKLLQYRRELLINWHTEEINDPSFCTLAYLAKRTYAPAISYWEFNTSRRQICILL